MNEESADSADSAVSKAKALVEDLKHFRDHYFEEHALSEASNKSKDVATKISETVKLLNDLQDSITNKALFYWLKGATLNVSPNFNAEAKELLSKSVKLDPALVEAWNELGECFWKNKEISAAYDCFNGANGHVKNKVSLRNLSMVKRQMGQSSAERKTQVEESVNTAKQAVQLDITDGTSWFVLGNAYLSLFFADQQNPKTLKQCMSAYSQAERDPVANMNPDLHYNRAVAYKFQEEYQLALTGCERALTLDPDWSEPSNKLQELISYLNTVNDMIKHKGKMKPKKVTGLASSLNETSLGPYKGGSYTSSQGLSITLKPALISSLSAEINTERVVLGKVVCNLSTDDQVPFTFCMVDIEEECIAVTVYNLAAGAGLKIGDSVAIPEPYVQNVNVEWKSKVISYRSIRVDSPLVLVVNGKKLGADKHAGLRFSTTVMSQ